MVTSNNIGRQPTKSRRVANKTNNKERRWNVTCDSETHEALDILGACMVSSNKNLPITDDKELKINLPKTRVIKILAIEKMKSLGLTKKGGGCY